MSESETIFRATDLDGGCWDYDSKPIWDEVEFASDGEYGRYHGPNKPPPGECWEIVQTRKGERPSGEAWERLLNVVADYARNSDLVGPRGEKVKDAWKAYAAASAGEPPEPQIDQRGLIKQLTKERDDLKERLGAVEFDRNSLKNRLKEGTQRLVAMIGSNGPEDLGEVIDRLIKRCEEKHNELSAALTELANERASGNQVIAERDATIAELQAKLERPEMPEAVRELVAAARNLPECMRFLGKEVGAVEAHYALPFRVEGPGVYAAKVGKNKDLVIRLFHHRQDGWLGYADGAGDVWIFDETGRAGGVQLTKFIRPLEG
jgi:hypothetical protein